MPHHAAGLHSRRLLPDAQCIWELRCYRVHARLHDWCTASLARSTPHAALPARRLARAPAWPAAATAGCSRRTRCARPPAATPAAPRSAPGCPRMPGSARAQGCAPGTAPGRPQRCRGPRRPPGLPRGTRAHRRRLPQRRTAGRARGRCPGEMRVGRHTPMADLRRRAARGWCRCRRRCRRAL